MSIEKKYKKLDDISHILMRPGMYCGSIKPHTSNRWVFNDGKFVQSELTFNPAFLKIFDEILVNSVDESKREGTKLKTIKVSVKYDIWRILEDKFDESYMRVQLITQRWVENVYDLNQVITRIMDADSEKMI